MGGSEPLDETLRDRLDALERDELLRDLRPASGIDFASNDYLGLSSDPRLADGIARRLDEARRAGVPVTAPASRLLRGETDVHRRLEARLAAWKGAEAALLFPSGYQANVGLLTALVGPQDRVVSDEQNHASLIDGIRLSRAAKVIVPHLDVGAVEEELRRPWPGGRTFVVTESLFSMDGDLAPLGRLADLCDVHGAALLVDDAHASGVFGERRGSGLLEDEGLERRPAAVVTTFGKALGAAGASVAGSRTLVRYLVNRCRSFVFSTAPPPLALFAVDAALDVVEAEPERRRRVLDLADHLRARLHAAGLDTLRSAGPVVPVVLGTSRRALQTADALQRQGFDVRAIRPPTVAPGTDRLRISVHTDHDREILDRLADAVVRAVRAAETRPVELATA